MARISKLSKDKYEIWIRTDDPGYYPHMHIWDYSAKGKNFHSCIRLDVPEYFSHTGKEDTLNTKLKKELIDFYQVVMKMNQRKKLEYINY